jgi:hypothetical protein
VSDVEGGRTRWKLVRRNGVEEGRDEDEPKKCCKRRSGTVKAESLSTALKRREEVAERTLT